MVLAAEPWLRDACKNRGFSSLDRLGRADMHPKAFQPDPKQAARLRSAIE